MADDETNTGAMVALILDEDEAQELALDDGEPAKELHCTLLYLGEADELDPDTIATVLEWAADAAADLGPLAAEAFASALFNPGGDEPCVTLVLSGPDLTRARAAATELADELDDMDAEIPDQHQPWIPHITLAYTDDPDMVGEAADRTGWVTFDRLRVAVGDEVWDFPLGEADDESEVDDEPDGEGEDTEDQGEDVQRAAGHDVTPGHDELHHWWTKGSGLKLWAASPKPWTTLHTLLTAALRENGRTVPPEQVKRWVSAWVHEVTGMWSGSDAYRVAHGGKPRGKRIGPG